MILLGHNLLDGIRVPFWFPGIAGAGADSGGILWMLLHQSGFFPLGGPNGPVVFDRYPVLPWFGLLSPPATSWPRSTRWPSRRGGVRFLATAPS